MPLTFEFPEGIDMTLVEYKKEDGSLHWHPRAKTLVFYTMLLQHDIDGEMTDKALREIDRRIRLIDLHHTHVSYWEGNKGYRITLADVVTYWGLTTNAGHLSPTKWNSYYKRCFIERMDYTPAESLRSTDRGEPYHTRAS